MCNQWRQISLGSRPVWSESLLCIQWAAKGPSFLHADSENSYQTGWMPRLICLHWAHMRFCWFCRVLAVILWVLIGITSVTQIQSSQCQQGIFGAKTCLNITSLITRGPWATTLTWVNCCKWIRSFTQHSLLAHQVSRQWLEQFFRYLAYKVKMLKFSKGHKLKKFRFFSEVNWFIYLSCHLKGFFFSIFSPGNHFVQ